MFKYRHLFFLPSFYLLTTFSVAYFFYLLDVIKWEKPPVELHFWCIITIITALLSVLINSQKFNTRINEASFKLQIKSPFLTNKGRIVLLTIIAIIGILGIVKYVLDYSKFLGAFGVFYSIFMEDTGQLRTLAENVQSIGIQISYCSWLAIFILSIDVANGQLKKKWIFIIIVLILCNSIFLDRSRPVLIIFTSALSCFMVTYDKYTRKKLLSFISAIISFFIGIFIFIGAMLGKGSGDENYTVFQLPKEVQPLFLYLTSSFAYLGRLIYYDRPCDYAPIRIAYPIQKILAALHQAKQPPSPILDFFSVPLLTNTGTFLEPFFQDGGRLFLVVAILLHTFIFDEIAFYFLKRISPMAIISISIICFVNFIAFFVPWATSAAVWFILLFCFLLSKFYYNNKGVAAAIT